MLMSVRCPKMLKAMRLTWFIVLTALISASISCSVASEVHRALAPVEVRCPWSPEAFTGSDGHVHAAYELHVSNFYSDTGVLRLRQLVVLSDDSRTPLATFDAAALVKMVSPRLAEGAQAGDNLAIKSGMRAVIFVWLTMPDRQALPRTLRHRLLLDNMHGDEETVDGALVTIDGTKPVSVGPPLHGRWIATEGPGNSMSHHWGSLVAVNGALTIPQRYALDLIGVDAQGRVLRKGAGDYRQSALPDWIGYGADVLAVGDGVVVGSHDGEVDHQPLAPQPEPSSLTADGLYGNYVVLRIAPNLYAHYAHLQHGSVTVRVGQKVRRGTVLGHVGQSGMSSGPHLHFQMSNAATFEGSEGIPFVLDNFQLLGRWSVTEAIDPNARLPSNTDVSSRPLQALPLDNDLIRFSSSPLRGQ